MFESEETTVSLTDIDQLALRAIIDHLEPHDCQWNLYGEAAQSVVDAIQVPIQLKAIRAWADALEAHLAEISEDNVELRPADLRQRADALEAEHARKLAQRETAAND